MQSNSYQTKLTSAVADAGSYFIRVDDADKLYRVSDSPGLRVGGVAIPETSFRVKFGPSGIDVFNFSGTSWESGSVAELSIKFLERQDADFARIVSRKRPRSAIVLGDSISAQSEVILAATSVGRVSPDVVRVVRTSHNMDAGQMVRVSGASDATANFWDATVATRVDANTLDIALTGAGRKHSVTSSSTPSIYMPLRRSVRGWLNWLEFYAKEQFDTTWCAVGGATIRQIDALFSATNPLPQDIAFVMLGMNDIYSKSRTLSQMQQDMRRLLQKVQQVATNVCVLSVTCRNSADSAWSSDKQTIHNGFNQWLYEYCRQHGFTFVNTWRAAQGSTTYVDGSATEPDMSASIAFDNTHPSATGAHALGKAVYDSYPTSFWQSGPTSAHLDQLGADSGNLLTDSGFVTNSSGVATGWATASSTANMNVAATCVARTVAIDGDACGFKQQYVISYGTATGTASTQFKKTSVHSLMTPGRKVRFSVDVSVDTSAVGLLGIETTIFGTTANGFWLVYGMNLDSSVDVMTGTFSGRIFTPPAVVPPDLSDAFLYVRPYISSAQSSSLTFSFWHPRLEYVD